MKGLNNYAKHQLMGRLLLPFCILLVFNVLLYYWSDENVVKLVVFIISMVLVTLMALTVIFYPKLMDIKIHTLSYDDYLYEMIERYEEWLQTINQRITTTENTNLRHFIIGKKKKRTPEMMAKLLKEAEANKANILLICQADKKEAEIKLDFYKTEKAECEKMVKQYYGRISHSG